MSAKRVKRRHTGIGSRMKSLGFSAVPDRDIVPENRIRGGSDFLSLPGRERSHKGFQLVRKQLGRGRTLWPLPQVQMPEDLADHLRLLDPGDDLHFAATVGTTKWIDFVNLFEEPGPATTTLADEMFPI